MDQPVEGGHGVGQGQGHGQRARTGHDTIGSIRGTEF